jgi:hypothetical protein
MPCNSSIVEVASIEPTTWLFERIGTLTRTSSWFAAPGRAAAVNSGWPFPSTTENRPCVSLSL